MHAWNLVRAIGANEWLNVDLVEHTWRDIAPMVSTIGTMGVFGNGASGTLTQEAPLQLKLLHACGRRPGQIRTH